MMSIKRFFRQKKICCSWGVLLILSLGVIGEISVFELLVPSIDINENLQQSFYTPRLASDQYSSLNPSKNSTKQLSPSVTSSTKKNQSPLGIFTDFREPSVRYTDIPQISFGITENPDLNITGITPRAMEKSAASMTFTINLTLPEKIGSDVNVVENLTITNGTFFPITGWTGWTELQDENGTFIDRYTLEFYLNNTFLSSLDLGSYDLIMYTNVSGHVSSDLIPLPMQDVWVYIPSVSPPEFNNKLDTEQFFTVEIEVSYETSVGNFSVDFLPVNPTASVKSVSSSGFLQFLGFISNNTGGQFTLNYSLPANIAQDFEDGDHELIISVTTSEWITDNATTLFTAKGTTYQVRIDEITVESNSPINYDDLMTVSQEDVILRLNVDDSVNVSFYIYDSENEQNSTRVHSVGYQNPKEPEDPTALLYEETLDSGTGSISLTANDVTPEAGYTLLFFVRGHRTSQESEKSSNITIYWDLLSFNYTYSDNTHAQGSSFAPNQKALGLDVNETWILEIGLYYASDGTSALNGSVYFRFGGGTWSKITDGLDGDILDGLFRMNNTHTSASEVLFECNITGGSSFDPPELIFVDRTLGANNLSLLVTWTYLIIEMIPVEHDHRLSIITATTTNQTYIFLNATWAHNTSLHFEEQLTVYNHFYRATSDVEMIAGEGIYPVLSNTITGIYRYSIINVTDNTFGITKFTNSTHTQLDNPQVEVSLIWEAIEFIYSDFLYTNLTNWDNMGVEYFFTNYGENGTLFVYGRHTYDNSTFNGTARLLDYGFGGIYELTFVNGIATWYDDLTASFPIIFAIIDIIQDIDFGIRGVGSFNEVTISWDKIVLTLEANHSYSHGTWADVYVSLSYLVSGKLVDPSKVRYNLLLSNGTFFENISWLMFRDYSFGIANHTYFVTNVFDTNTGLSKAEIRFRWTDQVDKDPVIGDLTIFWIDDKKPTIIQLYTVDLGNGSILIVIDVVDDSKKWLGSGIGSIDLFDLRGAVNASFSGKSKYTLLPSGIYRYFFKYSYDQEFEDVGDSFRFDFDEELIFSIRITDNRLNFVETDTFTIKASNDQFNPSFIPKNGIYILVFYHNLTDVLNTRPDISDGDVSITVFVQDLIWSGIDRNSVELIIMDLDNNINTSHIMNIFDPDAFTRDELRFEFNITLRVGGTYQFTVNIVDKSGNGISQTIEITIEDHVAPRVNSVDIDVTIDRELIIIITTSEFGYGIDYVRVGFLDLSGNLIQWVNLTKRVGGGSSIDSNSEEFYATAVLPFELDNLISIKRYSINVSIADFAGNQKIYSFSELDLFELDIDDTIQPLYSHPMILLAGVIIFLFGIVVAIRITSKTEGYDMKRIFDDAEKISREVILTQMDEYALGVTINFFDQVQGPVPVIWEPALLEDQEQVMLDLADKSFSTLEFIGLEETERSGTFDFSTGSYDCTALGYSFAIDNPKARGGKENLTVVLLLRKEWGDNLLVFQDELTEKLREIREMIETEKEPSQIEKKARELREFVSRVMLSFNKIYANMDYEVGMQEEIE